MELALLAPFLGLLVVAGVDFARVFYFSLTLTNCARNGAVYASIDDEHAVDDSGIELAALADASNISPAPAVTSEQITDAEGNPAIRVTVTWTFQTLTRPPGFPVEFELTRTVQMRIAPHLPDNS